MIKIKTITDTLLIIEKTSKEDELETLEFTSRNLISCEKNIKPIIFLKNKNGYIFSYFSSEKNVGSKHFNEYISVYFSCYFNNNREKRYTIMIREKYTENCTDFLKTLKGFDIIKDFTHLYKLI
jgi:hypothetical protein